MDSAAAQEGGNVFVSITALVEAGANKPFLPTRSSVEFFIRKHRLELVERDALITRRGALGSLVHRERFPAVVAEIMKRDAVQHARATS